VPARKAVVDPEEETPPAPGNDLTKIANLLALHLVRDKNKTESASALSSAGFAVHEIARLLGTTPKSVSQAIYVSKQGADAAKPPKRRPIEPR
jgi:hypothetical protein